MATSGSSDCELLGAESVWGAAHEPPNSRSPAWTTKVPPDCGWTQAATALPSGLTATSGVSAPPAGGEKGSGLRQGDGVTPRAGRFQAQAARPLRARWRRHVCGSRGTSAQHRNTQRICRGPIGTTGICGAASGLTEAGRIGQGVGWSVLQPAPDPVGVEAVAVVAADREQLARLPVDLPALRAPTATTYGDSACSCLQGPCGSRGGPLRPLVGPFTGGHGGACRSEGPEAGSLLETGKVERGGTGRHAPEFTRGEIAPGVMTAHPARPEGSVCHCDRAHGGARWPTDIASP